MFGSSYKCLHSVRARYFTNSSPILESDPTTVQKLDNWSFTKQLQQYERFQEDSTMPLRFAPAFEKNKRPDTGTKLLTRSNTGSVKNGSNLWHVYSVSLLSRVNSINPKQLCICLNAILKSGYRNNELFFDILYRYSSSIHRCNVQDIASILSTLSQMEIFDKVVFSKYVDYLNCNVINDCGSSAVDLSKDEGLKSFRSLKSVGHFEGEKFETRPDIGKVYLSSFSPKDIASIANALAKASVKEAFLFNCFTDYIVGSRVQSFSIVDLSIVSNAYAKLGLVNYRNLFGILMEKISAKISDANPQILSNVSNAFCKLNCRNTTFYRMLATETVYQCERFSPLHIAMSLNAYSKMGLAQYGGVDVGRAMLPRIIEILDLFTFKQLSVTANALAKLLSRSWKPGSEIESYEGAHAPVFAFSKNTPEDITPADCVPRDKLLILFFEEVSKRCGSNTYKDCGTALEISALANAYAKMNINDSILMKHVRLMSLKKLSSFNSWSTSALLNSLSKFNYMDGVVAAEFKQHICSNIKLFSIQDISLISNAYYRSGYIDNDLIAFLFKQLQSLIAVSNNHSEGLYDRDMSDCGIGVTPILSSQHLVNVLSAWSTATNLSQLTKILEFLLPFVSSATSATNPVESILLLHALSSISSATRQTFSSSVALLYKRTVKFLRLQIMRLGHQMSAIPASYLCLCINSLSRISKPLVLGGDGTLELALNAIVPYIILERDKLSNLHYNMLCHSLASAFYGIESVGYLIRIFQDRYQLPTMTSLISCVTDDLSPGQTSLIGAEVLKLIDAPISADDHALTIATSCDKCARLDTDLVVGRTIMLDLCQKASKLCKRLELTCFHSSLILNSFIRLGVVHQPFILALYSAIMSDNISPNDLPTAVNLLHSFSLYCCFPRPTVYTLQEESRASVNVPFTHRIENVSDSEKVQVVLFKLLDYCALHLGGLHSNESQHASLGPENSHVFNYKSNRLKGSQMKLSIAIRAMHLLSLLGSANISAKVPFGHDDSVASANPTLNASYMLVTAHGLNYEPGKEETMTQKNRGVPARACGSLVPNGVAAYDSAKRVIARMLNSGIIKSLQMSSVESECTVGPFMIDFALTNRRL